MREFWGELNNAVVGEKKKEGKFDEVNSCEYKNRCNEGGWKKRRRRKDESDERVEIEEEYKRGEKVVDREVTRKDSSLGCLKERRYFFVIFI